MRVSTCLPHCKATQVLILDKRTLRREGPRAVVRHHHLCRLVVDVRSLGACIKARCYAWGDGPICREETGSDEPPEVEDAALTLEDTTDVDTGRVVPSVADGLVGRVECRVGHERGCAVLEGCGVRYVRAKCIGGCDAEGVAV